MATAAPAKWLSPRQIVAAPGEAELYISAATGNQVLVFDRSSQKVTRKISIGGTAAGLLFHPDGKTLFVAEAETKGKVHRVDPATGKIQKSIPVGHTPFALCLSADHQTLYVANQLSSDISVVDLAAGKETQRIPVLREPVDLALTPDGKTLLAVNLIPVGPSDDAFSSCDLSLIDTASGKVRAHVPLINGAHSAREVWISPDGKTACVSHILAHYQVPTTQLERGWMNTAALTLVDLASAKSTYSVLLDSVEKGAANPWAVAASSDARQLAVTHAGSQELSVIDLTALHQALKDADPQVVSCDLAFLTDLRKRIPLPGNGPRGVIWVNDRIYVTEYYSDTLAVVDPSAPPSRAASSVALGPTPLPDQVRQGEIIFHDARNCFQTWQSCLSCHPGVRSDALNWDLLNDGMGNPKNSKSLLLSHETPPAMALGVRARAEVAVRAGLRYIQFAVRPEEDAQAIDAYLRSLKPAPSPLLEQGKLSATARKGKKVFEAQNCAACHNGPYYTDLQRHPMGTTRGLDKGRPTDTPMLIETWRSAPYLHDGRSGTLTHLFAKEKHGITKPLSETELKELVEYVGSL